MTTTVHSTTSGLEESLIIGDETMETAVAVNTATETSLTLIPLAGKTLLGAILGLVADGKLALGKTDTNDLGISFLTADGKLAPGKERYDAYRSNPESVPADCNGKVVFFLNHITLYSTGLLVVRCLDCRSSQMELGYKWLGNGCDGDWVATVAS